MKSEPLARFALAQTRVRLKRVIAALRRAARKPDDPESAHRLRVANRRLLVCLQMFDGLFSRKAAEKLQKRARKLIELCRSKRDYDVALQVLAQAELRPYHSVVLKCGKRRDEEARRLSRRLKKRVARSKGWADRWKKQLKLAKRPHGEWRPMLAIADHARKALPQLARKFFAQGDRAADARGDYETLHQFRLRAKSFRYGLEVLHAAHGSDASAKLQDLRELQDRIGAVNDSVVVLALPELDRAAASAVRRQLVIQERRFQEHWSTAFSQECREQWIAWLAGPTPDEKRHTRADNAGSKTVPRASGRRQV